MDGKRISYETMHPWELYSLSIRTELRQCIDEGRDVEGYRAVVEAVDALPLGDTREELADVLYRALTTAPIRADYPYAEPDELAAIQAARPAKRPEARPLPDEATLRDRIRGAWLGRICGCLLGKPVEGWRSWHIRELAGAQGNWPLSRYLLRDEAKLTDMGRPGDVNRTWADALDGAAPSDDDTNYTAMAALRIVGRHGRGFTPADVANEWMASQPKNAYCTAERRAFCNFVAGIMPPHSAMYKNPDREYIGAQIRADYFGYICPGDTQTAADMAWRDACISHVKNGIYGEMFVAAMLARAAVSDDVPDVIEAGLAEIPEKCRLTEAVREAMEWHAQGVEADECFRRIHEKYNEDDAYDWVHTISNAGIVALCLLYAQGDYDRGICMAVEQGFDTDCNGATVGSIIGMMKGSAAIGDKWTAPTCGRLRTDIFGCEVFSIDELIDITMSHMAQ